MAVPHSRPDAIDCEMRAANASPLFSAADRAGLEQNRKVIFNLLFHSSAQTLLEVALHPLHFGVEIGFFTVLHTWNERLQFHPHTTVCMSS
jgi:hypothetical protein